MKMRKKPNLEDICTPLIENKADSNLVARTCSAINKRKRQLIMIGIVTVALLFGYYAFLRKPYKNITKSKDLVEMAPQWSPNGQRIAFLATPYSEEERHPEPNEVYVMGREGTNVKCLSKTIDEPRFYNIKWSPDSKMVAFCKLPGGYRTPGVIAVYSLEDDELIKLCKTHDTTLSWLGTKLCYKQFELETNSEKMFVWDSRSKKSYERSREEMELFARSSLSDWKYSPASKAKYNFPSQDEMEVFLENGRKITLKGGGSPTWSHCGNYLAFQTIASTKTPHDTYNISVISLKTGKIINLVRGGLWPDWSPDDKYLAFGWKGDIWLYDWGHKKGD